ncbi:hypothetical protein [Marispirochaeta aestuarii]|uniref:hypothetical protein n=1 Tax=Marispirochaeta aestuarii TaxID=1963862 RepID=UPI0029C97F4E|nr:hypothetical protein [Marispirochaeta aestuarii]
MRRYTILILLAILIFGFSCASAQEKPLHPQTRSVEQPQSTVMPQNGIYKGIIIERKSNPGTLSEYSYYILKTDGNEYILFNSTLNSAGFGEWKNKEVVIEANAGEGGIGFKKQKTEGLIVMSILSEDK